MEEDLPEGVDEPLPLAASVAMFLVDFLRLGVLDGVALLSIGGGGQGQGGRS
jgi:hypothetical protein